MYIPSPFFVADPVILKQFIANYPFGTLISLSNGALTASHVPLIVREKGTTVSLWTHIARSNLQHSDIDGQEVLLSFLGPHAYISPRWYNTRRNVPTWDYAAVQIQGTAFKVQDPERVIEFLDDLTNKFEASNEDSWTIAEIDPINLSRMCSEIVVLEISVAKFEGAYKLSQNRTSDERLRVARALQETGRQEDTEIAALILETLSGAEH